MLTIEEAIVHARDVANTQRGKSGICLQNGLECEHFSDCLKCAEEHEQLAEWLKELKAIKDDGKAIRNKAIDDFIHECDKHCEFYSGKNKIITREDILKIAEQVKQGSVSDSSNDVCVWYKVNGNACKCYTHAEIYDSRVLDWCKCPYCGKKIKIVGD